MLLRCSATTRKAARKAPSAPELATVSGGGGLVARYLKKRSWCFCDPPWLAQSLYIYIYTHTYTSGVYIRLPGFLEWGSCKVLTTRNRYPICQKVFCWFSCFVSFVLEKFTSQKGVDILGDWKDETKFTLMYIYIYIHIIHTCIYVSRGFLRRAPWVSSWGSLCYVIRLALCVFFQHHLSVHKCTFP